jgi:hypothetical protein
MRFKLDLSTVQDFFIYHGEKVAVGFVGLVFLWCFVRAVSISGRTVDFSPEQLRSEAQSALEHIEQGTPGEPIQITDYVAIARRIRDRIDETFYRHEVLWDPPLWERKGMRGEPPVFGLEKIRAVAGNGVFNMIDPKAPPTSAAQAASPTRGQRWVVVTGLIPIAKQLEAYQETFKDAIYRDPQRDYPLYIHYWVERAEIPAEGQTGQLRWVRIDPRMMMWYFVRLWRGGSPEVVHPAYIPRSLPQGTPLVFPLGPRVGESWGPEVAFPPEIPLASAMQPTPGAGGYPGEMASYPGMPSPGPVPMATPGGYPGSPGYPGEETYSETMYPGGPMPYGGPTVSTYPGSPAGPGMPGTPMPGGPGPGIIPPLGEVPGLPGLSGTEPSAPGQEASSQQPSGAGRLVAPGTSGPSPATLQVKYQLFRFFDFTVQPGKQYVYRVQLLLYNPNYRLDPQYLERPELAEQPWLETQWSDATEPVRVPMDARLIAGPVKPAPTVLHEPQANVVILAFREEDGLRTYQDFTLLRGQLANLEGTIAKASLRPGYPGSEMYPGASGLEELYMPETMGSPAAPGMPAPGAPGGARSGRPGTPTRPGQKPEEEKFLYKTEMLVVDIAGGTRLHRSESSLTEPGQVLVMDPNGALIVLDELAHLAEYQLYHKEPEQPTRKPAAGRGPEGPSGYMAEMPEEMYDAYMMEYETARRGARGRGSRTRPTGSPGRPGAVSRGP